MQISAVDFLFCLAEMSAVQLIQSVVAFPLNPCQRMKATLAVLEKGVKCLLFEVYMDPWQLQR